MSPVFFWTELTVFSRKKKVATIWLPLPAWLRSNHTASQPVGPVLKGAFACTAVLQITLCTVSFFLKCIQVDMQLENYSQVDPQCFLCSVCVSPPLGSRRAPMKRLRSSHKDKPMRWHCGFPNKVLWYTQTLNCSQSVHYRTLFWELMH